MTALKQYLGEIASLKSLALSPDTTLQARQELAVLSTVDAVVTVLQKDKLLIDREPGTGFPQALSSPLPQRAVKCRELIAERIDRVLARLEQEQLRAIRVHGPRRGGKTTHIRVLLEALAGRVTEKRWFVLVLQAHAWGTSPRTLRGTVGLIINAVVQCLRVQVPHWHNADLAEDIAMMKDAVISARWDSSEVGAALVTLLEVACFLVPERYGFAGTVLVVDDFEFTFFDINGEHHLNRHLLALLNLAEGPQVLALSVTSGTEGFQQAVAYTTFTGAATLTPWGGFSTDLYVHGYPLPDDPELVFETFGITFVADSLGGVLGHYWLAKDLGADQLHRLVDERWNEALQNVPQIIKHRKLSITESDFRSAMLDVVYGNFPGRFGPITREALLACGLLQELCSTYVSAFYSVKLIGWRGITIAVQTAARCAVHPAVLGFVLQDVVAAVWLQLGQPVVVNAMGAELVFPVVRRVERISQSRLEQHAPLDNNVMYIDAQTEEVEPAPSDRDLVAVELFVLDEIAPNKVVVTAVQQKLRRGDIGIAQIRSMLCNIGKHFIPHLLASLGEGGGTVTYHGVKKGVYELGKGAPPQSTDGLEAITVQCKETHYTFIVVLSLLADPDWNIQHSFPVLRVVWGGPAHRELFGPLYAALLCNPTFLSRLVLRHMPPDIDQYWTVTAVDETGTKQPQVLFVPKLVDGFPAAVVSSKLCHLWRGRVEVVASGKIDCDCNLGVCFSAITNNTHCTWEQVAPVPKRPRRIM
eukprot:TRINITY_DN12796_c0_g1_i1.p1 TRINITY_DN12796_c0_g1~~TRINITY_DN12796_c0_g1_i1.p1  ORF type:complete len:768 (-),score=129.25 TRINITY_DN12796_c0_g1_i1:191-2458(-)